MRKTIDGINSRKDSLIQINKNICVNCVFQIKLNFHLHFSQLCLQFWPKLVKQDNTETFSNYYSNCSKTCKQMKKKVKISQLKHVMTAASARQWKKTEDPLTASWSWGEKSACSRIPNMMPEMNIRGETEVETFCWCGFDSTDSVCTTCKLLPVKQVTHTIYNVSSSHMSFITHRKTNLKLMMLWQKKKKKRVETDAAYRERSAAATVRISDDGRWEQPAANHRWLICLLRDANDSLMSVHPPHDRNLMSKLDDTVFFQFIC